MSDEDELRRKVEDISAQLMRGYVENYMRVEEEFWKKRVEELKLAKDGPEGCPTPKNCASG